MVHDHGNATGTPCCPICCAAFLHEHPQPENGVSDSGDTAFLYRRIPGLKPSVDSRKFIVVVCGKDKVYRKVSSLTVFEGGAVRGGDNLKVFFPNPNRIIKTSGR